MARVIDIYRLLDSKYPYSIQEDYDNSGIMADCGREIDKIVVSLDITNAVVDYAESIGAQLIVSHHPLIFTPVKTIRFNSPLQKLLSAGISALSAHTNFDIYEGGVNDSLASRIGLHDILPVFKVSEKPVNGVIRQNFIGRMGMLPVEMSPAELARHTGECLLGRKEMEFVDGGHPIKKVAVGGGACGEFIFECPEFGIDAFITGEAKHHQLLFAKDNGITMIVAGHYATENIALEALAETISDGFPEITIVITRIDNPNSFTR